MRIPEGAIIAWILVLLCAVIAYLAPPWLPWESKVLNHQGLAAWVQALGTVVALAIAVWLPARQRAADRAEAEILYLQQLYQDLTKLHWLGESIMQVLSRAREQASRATIDGTSVRFDEHEYADMLERLRLVYMLDFGGRHTWRMCALHLRSGLTDGIQFVLGPDGRIRPIPESPDSRILSSMRTVSTETARAGIAAREIAVKLEALGKLG